MSHDQRFFWTEPFAFAQARACSASTGNRLLLATVLAGLLAIALVTADPPVSIRDFALVALFSVAPALRSEEHTSELQSLMRLSYAVFCLKKKHKEPTNKTD